MCIEYGRYPAVMIGYAPSHSFVDKQGMIACTGMYPLGQPRERQNPTLPRFFSPEHRSKNCNEKKVIFGRPQSRLASSRWDCVGRGWALYPKSSAHSKDEDSPQPLVAESGIADIR